MATIDYGNLTDAGEFQPLGYSPYTSAGNYIQIYSGFLVVSMHIGFAMLEAGSVRKGSAVNILFKNLGTLAIGALAYYSLGQGFGSGQLTIFGTGPFFFDLGLFQDYSNHGPWFFSFSFVATAATIVSGAVAGRIQLGGYFIMAFFITAVVYPPITGSIWATGGWISAFQSDPVNLILVGDDGEICGMFDYAGSGVVHMTGGVAAFWGALILGARKGRWEEPEAFAPHNYALTTMGTLFLWFGWYGFNCGSALGWYEGFIGKVAVTTTIAPCFAAVTAFTYARLVNKKWDLGVALNGILAGLVSITSGCPTIPNGLAAVAGVIGALVYIGGSKLMKKLGVDDPVDAVAVHGIAGAWGCIATGLMANPDLINAYYSVTCTKGPGTILQYQIIGILYIFAWVSVLVIPAFVALKFFGLLRVAEEDEKDLDMSEHGIGAYEVMDDK
jgi:Amt family ammonium transporter